MESKNIELITKMVIDAINQSEDKGNGFMVPIGVSARHVHLTQEHVEALFGPGYQLTKKKDLMGGQFASNETVTIVGLKLRAIEKVRVLGPVRSATQVEVSATDAIKLGMNVPVRMSGDIAGSAPIAIVGPKGAIYLKEGCIVAMRHIHMSPKDAQAAGVKNGDIVSVKADNERGTIFNHVAIRVDDSFTLEMHIDTDEANAAKIATGNTVTIVGLKLRAIENVRILGPVRSKSQVEVSATDAIKLGMKVPVRMSGDLAGSAPIAIVGPKGAIYLKEGCIVAMRHIHMAPKDAQAAGVHDGDIVSVKADNERGTIFNQVKIRVDDSFTLEMHIDTDEANAARIATGNTVTIIK